VPVSESEALSVGVLGRDVLSHHPGTDGAKRDHRGAVEAQSGTR
jgi:hypothetical protein